MANIMQLHPPKGPEGDMKEYKQKLIRHRAGLGTRFFVVLAVSLGVCLAIYFYQRNRSYTDYEVCVTVERSDTVNTQYAEYNGKLLKYSRDGISCVDAQNKAVWSQTYTMQTPIVDICQNEVVVASQQGNEIYVFDGKGLQTQITTLLPIQQVSVSAQGVTAVLLNDSTYAWIYLYDKEGNQLTEARCSLEETGQPLSISLSSDGTKLAVSYLQVQEGTAGSCVVFYNFGSVGSNFVDKIVASKVYSDTLIPKVKYLGSSQCVAISGEGIIYYEGAEIPEEQHTVTVEKEIRSIFFGENRVGLILEGEGGDAGRYQLRLYDMKGNLVLSETSDLDYRQAKLSGKYLILYGANECEIYSDRGVLKYTGSFDSEIADIYKTKGLERYVLVFSDRTEEIKLQ